MAELTSILIVDDERVNRKLLAGILKGCELNIVSAASGEEALELVDQEEFAMVLMDVMMPEMDGFSVAQKLRSMEHTKNTPIIFVTAISKEEQHVFRGYELGAVDYLFKPVEPEILKSKVRVFVELHRKTKGLEETTKNLESIVSELEKSRSALQESERRYRMVADYNYDWESWHAPDGTPLYVSPSCERISGYSPRVFMEDTDFFEKIVHGEDVEPLRRFVANPDHSGDPFDFRIYTKNNQMRWISLVRREIFDNDGVSLGVRASMRDITSRKLIENRMLHQSLHDPLTGLPNRTLFQDRVSRTAAGALRHKKYFAVAFLDLDRFKIINDSMGHNFGDKLLISVAVRLQEAVRNQDTVSRFGGDEFAILFDEMESLSEAKKIARRLVDSVRKPFEIDNHQIRLTVSMGLDVSKTDDQSAESRVQNAHIAMYRAKEEGKDRFLCYTEKMRETAQRKMALESELRSALERKEFELYYQPIMDLSSRKLYGFEALLRWKHPERGIVGPGEFIHLAEETGFIVDLGGWVLEEACSTMKRWQEHRNGYGSNLSIAVNISAKQFREPGLVDSVSDILRRTGLDPRYLKLEITETVVMGDAHDSVHKLNMLKDLGVILSIDDFGTGYSSMSYLQRFPIDQLKIDLSFVQRLDVDPESIEIVRAIINLAHGLSLQTVGEGIENRQQLSLLYSLQCDYGQGYLIDKPLPLAQAEEFISNKDPLP